MSKANKPIKNIRAGNIRAAVWMNKSEGGADYHSVTVTRSYKVDDEWKESAVFGRDDLPRVELVTRKAYEFIFLVAGKTKGETFAERVADEDELDIAV